ncbi:MAG TPA: hypothetical protein VGD49_09250 [Longimicrobiales bacterium]
MMTHPSYEELNDYVDALLDERSAESLRAHSATCADCRSTIAQLQALRDAARSLPRAETPPADVWNTIRAATIDNARAQRARVLWQLRYQLAAAAVVLLMVASSVTWWIASQRQAAPVAQAPAIAPNATLAAYHAVEAEYTQAADDLMRLLEQRRERMDTAVVRSVEENLRVMDDAIRKAQTALLSDPANYDVAAILAATQESKLRMLRRAVDAAGGT